MNKISISCITDTQIYFQPAAQYLVVMLLHVSATSRSHLQGAEVNNCCLCPPVRRTVYSPNISRQENPHLRMLSLLLPYLFSVSQHTPTLSHVCDAIKLAVHIQPPTSMEKYKGHSNEKRKICMKFVIRNCP
jgi:hypothetical protein